VNSELSTGGTSAIFTAPAAGATALVATFRFSEPVDQMGASTDFPLTITVLAPSTARNWDATVDAPGSPATLTSAGGAQDHNVTFPFNMTESRAKVTFVLAPYATLAEGAGNNNAGSPSLSLVGGNPVLEITLPSTAGQSVMCAFTTTSQSGAISSWSISFVVEDYPLNWFNNGWTATVSGLLIGPSSLDSAVDGNGTFVWAESEANTPQTFHITIAPGAVMSPPLAGRDVPITLGPAGTSGVVTFRIQSPGDIWASWVFTVRVNKDSANTGTDDGNGAGSSSSSSSSSSSTGDGGGTKLPVDPPPDQNNFDGAATAITTRGTGPSMMLLPAVLFAALCVVFDQMTQPAQGTL
jgi:hypothetical protein